jgi:hypothetical protein
MAIDTQEKRMAAAGVGRPFMRAHFPVATPDTEWRAASGLSYGANGIASPVGGASTIAMARGVTRFTFTRVFGRVN